MTEAVNIAQKIPETTTFVVGKRVAVLARNASGAATGLAHSGAVLAMMGLGATVSAGVTQMEYNHKRENTRKSYQEELAAKLHKPLLGVSDNDLDMVAKNNRVIGEELNQQKRQRNFGVFFSIAATLVSLLVVTELMNPLVLPLANEWVKWGAEMLIEGAIGLLTYNVVKQPLHWLGNKLFDLDKETTHDRIVAMKRDREEGKQISREQVLAVYASAHPQLERYIAAQYGDKFDELPLAAKQQAAEDISKLAPLDQLAAAINQGRINVTELAFAVEGQVSGVEHAPSPAPQKKPGIITTVISKMRNALHLRAATAMQVEQTPAPQKTAVVAMAFAETAPSRPFVQRVGRSPADATLTMVERLAQRTANKPVGMDAPQ